MEKIFDKSKYDQEYRRKFKKQFNVDLSEEEKKELLYLISKNGFKSNRDFLLKCIEIMKSEKNIIKK